MKLGDFLSGWLRIHLNSRRLIVFLNILRPILAHSMLDLIIPLFGVTCVVFFIIILLYILFMHVFELYMHEFYTSSYLDFYPNNC